MQVHRRFLCPNHFFTYTKAIQKCWINDGPIDEQFHALPMGQSDMGMQTRLSFLSKDMTGETSRIGIKGISPSGFRLYDSSFVFGPIAVFPKTVLSWRVTTPKDIVPESLELFFTLQPKPDVLLIGVGEKENIDSVRNQIIPILLKNNVGYEILTTENAIATFNFCNAERRNVCAALYPPVNLAINEPDFGIALRSLMDYELDENPILFGSNFTGDPLTDVVRNIWGKGPEAEQARETLSRLRSQINSKKGEYYLKKRAEKAEEPAQITQEEAIRQLNDIANHVAPKKIDEK